MKPALLDHSIIRVLVMPRMIVLSRCIFAWGLIALGLILNSAQFLIVDIWGGDRLMCGPLFLSGLLLVLSLIPVI